MFYIKILLNNLLIVFVTELPLALLLGARSPKKITSVALINIITNPAIVYISLLTLFFAGEWHTPVLIILEIAVLFIEGFTFSKFKTFDKKNPYLISIVLNATSFITGEIIEKVFY